VWVDAEDDMCGWCAKQDKPFMRCSQFNVTLGWREQQGQLAFIRCQACLEAESPALQQAGHDRDARAQMPTLPNTGGADAEAMLQQGRHERGFRHE